MPLAFFIKHWLQNRYTEAGGRFIYFFSTTSLWYEKKLVTLSSKRKKTIICYYLQNNLFDHALIAKLWQNTTDETTCSLLVATKQQANKTHLWTLCPLFHKWAEQQKQKRLFKKYRNSFSTKKKKANDWQDNESFGFVCNNQPTANKADGQSEKKRFYLNLL